MVGWRIQRGPRDAAPKTTTAPAPAAEPTPPRDIPWTNRTDMSGSCPCIGIYSECRCTPK